jgi:hypothetical protein
MKSKTIFLEYIILIFIFSGCLISVFNFLNIRSLWLDEARLALSIINKPVNDLFKPLEMNQVAPIGFLLVEKFFSYLGGNTDWALRIFPMLSFFISIFLIYRLSVLIFQEKFYALFATAFYSLSYFIIFYSSEVKQYMSDVVVCLIILLYAMVFIQKNGRKQLYTYSLIGIISIWFSNISIIMLFSIGVYILYKIQVGNKNYSNTLVLLGSWSISFVIYYLLFIHNHPAKSFMIDYWSNEGAFLPKNIFSLEFYRGLYALISTFIRLSGYGSYPNKVLFLFFVIGLYFLYTKKKEFLYLLIFPVIVHLFLSYLNLYPFNSRLILYLYPSLIITSVSGIYYLITLLKPEFKRMALFTLLIPLVFKLIMLSKQNFVIEKEEIKKSLFYLNSEISQGDSMYIYYFSFPAYSFYKKKYSKLGRIPQKNISFGKNNRQDWSKHEKDISKNKGTIWILFSHDSYERDLNGLDEKAYILELFKKNGFKIVEEKHYKGSSIFKVNSLNHTPKQEL